MSNTDNKPLVSIIVPVYNAEKYLRRCMGSILAIEYENREIILVDDVGQDNSAVICDEYANQYKNVTVIHHDRNKGVAMARQTGYEHSHGDYIMFVDADDAVLPKILTTFVNVAITEEADVVSSNVFYRDDKAIYPEKRTIYGTFKRDEIKHLLSTNLLFDILVKRTGMPLYLCAKLFKRNILEGSLQKAFGFRYGEDIVVILDLLINKVNKLVCLNECLYEYYRHSCQVTSAGLIRLWPDYEKLWGYLDNLGVDGFDSQLQQRIWSYIKPSLYEPKAIWGGCRQYINIFKQVRNSGIVKKYIFNGKTLPKHMLRHPHYYFLKFRLYFIDYLFYYILWSVKKSSK